MPSRWRIEATADGSPSMFWTESERSESMHHSGGAFAETTYIYEPVIAACFSMPGPPLRVIVSLGLGLGYNELLIAKHAIQQKQDHSVSMPVQMQIYSYESDAWLREQFQDWLRGSETGCLAEVYSRICEHLEMSSIDLRKELRRMRDEQVLHLLPALSQAEQLPQAINVFLWDAFSKRLSPELWNETFLTRCFAKADPKGCAFASYAFNGNLKRALQASGFVVELRKGFRGKRGATQAIKLSAQSDD